MASELVNVESSKQLSPFMRLPAELCVMIYEYAMHNTGNSITPSTPDKPPPHLGALALLRTSNTVRKESCCAMLPIVSAHRVSLLNARQDILARRREVRVLLGPRRFALRQTPGLYQQFEEIKSQYEGSVRQYNCLSAVEGSLDRIARSYIGVSEVYGLV